MLSSRFRVHVYMSAAAKKFKKYSGNLVGIHCIYLFSSQLEGLVQLLGYFTLSFLSPFSYDPDTEFKFIYAQLFASNYYPLSFNGECV
jgi:hypothetical protein